MQYLNTDVGRGPKQLWCCFFLASITPGTQVDITLMVLASWLRWGLHSGCCMQVFPLVVQHVFQKVRARIGGYLFNCGTNVTWCSLHMGFNKPGLSICWLCCSHVGPSPQRRPKISLQWFSGGLAICHQPLCHIDWLVPVPWECQRRHQIWHSISWGDVPYENASSRG